MRITLQSSGTSRGRPESREEDHTCRLLSRMRPSRTLSLEEGTLCYLLSMRYRPDGRVGSTSFLFLVVRPGAPSSVLAPSSDARSPQ